MAFGIDDALFIAAGGISLADTLATVIRNYGGKIDDIDIETLIEQVRVEALRRIKAADGALADFEKLLNDKDVDANMSVTEAIERTRIWNWSERRSLSSIVDDFNELHKRIYGAIDDVAALVQCKGRGLPRICSCGKFGEKAQVSRELFERAHYQGKNSYTASRA